MEIRLSFVLQSHWRSPIAACFLQLQKWTDFKIFNKPNFGIDHRNDLFGSQAVEEQLPKSTKKDKKLQNRKQQNQKIQLEGLKAISQQ